MNPVLVQLVNDTIGLLDAVRHGDVKQAWSFANRVRTVGWANGMAALAAAAGAFQHSVETGARSEEEMALAIQDAEGPDEAGRHALALMPGTGRRKMEIVWQAHQGP